MELRFRAKNPETNKWNYFGIYNVPSWIGEVNIEPCIRDKDKNGIPIFEGDIVEHKNFGGGVVILGSQPMSRSVVKWDTHHHGYKLKGLGFIFEGSDIEIIGNITDNPELIENAQ